MFRSDISRIPAYRAGKTAPNALKLSSNEAAAGPLPAVLEAAARAAAQAHRYPDMTSTSVAEALGAKLGYSSDEVLVGNGSTTLLQLLARATCLSPSDEIIFPWPSFEAYPGFALVVGAQPRPIALLDDGRHDLDGMIDAITGNTRLIYVCNPNNPTGTVITRDEFARFMERVPSHILVALDEAYFEYNHAPDQPNAVEECRRYPNLIGLRTFSKAYGLAGMRVGYAFGNAQLIDAVRRVQEPFSVNLVAQAAALAALEHEAEVQAQVREVLGCRDRVADEMGVPRSQGNFVWFATEHSVEIGKQLAEHGVIVRALPAGVRVTITNAPEMDTFLRAWSAVRPARDSSSLS